MGNRMAMSTRVVAAVVAMAAAVAAAPARAEPLPAGFVYLRDVDASIVQQMRYAGPDNFVGRPVDGYEAGECILLKAAAEGLKKAQALLKPKGLSLKVYDCYRPARAVAHFGRWAEDAADQKTKPVHYPRIDKSKLFGLGWIARISGHSRGGSVDLTIVPLGAVPLGAVPPGAVPRPPVGEARACTAPFDKASAAGALDLGTTYDCFDELSATRHPAVKGEAARNRARLLAVMTAAGFRNYAKEWWHFDHEAFPVRARGQ
jgi:D-alanyl-D-alanine dipeptidase